MRVPRPLLTLVAVTGLLLAVGCGADTPTSTSTTAPDALVDIGAGLQGPAGVQATVDGQGPEKLSALALDAQGRLWMATADYSDSGTDGVYLIPRSGAPALEVVGGLHTALGLLWYDGSLFVSSKERVDAYSGFDGTAFAEHHTVLTLPTGVGEVNGIVLAPSGRMQLGISAPCDSCTPSSPYSAAVVSFLPDGSDLQVDASGIRAPIGLTYYPGTTDLLVTMNQRDDLDPNTPGDWVSVVAPGQNWGFPQCYGQDDAACAGVPSPTGVLDPHAAVSGVAIVTGSLGPSVGNSALVAEWAFGKVQRVALTADGSTYTGVVSPFLTGIQKPVPVLTAADGSLLVGDWATGTIYRIARA